MHRYNNYTLTGAAIYKDTKSAYSFSRRVCVTDEAGSRHVCVAGTQSGGGGIYSEASITA